MQIPLAYHIIPRFDRLGKTLMIFVLILFQVPAKWVFSIKSISMVDCVNIGTPSWQVDFASLCIEAMVQVVYVFKRPRIMDGLFSYLPRVFSCFLLHL